MLKYVTIALGSLAFTVQEEPLFLIYTINRITSGQGAASLEKLKKYFKGLLGQTQNVDPKLVYDLKVGIAMCLLLRLKKFLKGFYSLNDGKIQTYLPTDSKASPVSLRVPIENVDWDKTLTLEDLAVQDSKWEASFDTCYNLYILFKEAMKNDEQDYSIYPRGKKPKPKRKRNQPIKTRKGGPKRKKLKSIDGDDEYQP